MTVYIIDSHCHLDYDGLSERLPAVLSAAAGANVRLMLSISTRVAKFQGLLAIACRYDNVYCTVGTHPHAAHEELDITANKLVDLAAHPRVVGLGEVGLDYFYDKSPRTAQLQGFHTHITAAQETGLPLVIHAREADADIAAVLSERVKEKPFPFILHCFTASHELALRGVDLGGYISFSGILTYKSAQNLRDIAMALPADRLLVETDSPYLAPVPHRGKPNEPAFVVETLKVLGEVRGVSVAEAARTTSENFFRLFTKVPRPADCCA